MPTEELYSDPRRQAAKEALEEDKARRFSTVAGKFTPPPDMTPEQESKWGQALEGQEAERTQEAVAKRQEEWRPKEPEVKPPTPYEELSPSTTYTEEQVAQIKQASLYPRPTDRKEPTAEDAQLAGEIALGFTPAGVLIDAKDLYQALERRDPVMAAMAGIGFIPGMGDIAKGAFGALRRGEKSAAITRATRQKLDQLNHARRLWLEVGENSPYFLNWAGTANLPGRQVVDIGDLNMMRDRTFKKGNDPIAASVAYESMKEGEVLEHVKELGPRYMREMLDKQGGGPLVVRGFHGTKNFIGDQVDLNRSTDLGFHIGTNESSQNFARTSAFSRQEPSQVRKRGEPEILPVYARFDNPFLMDDMGNWNPGDVIKRAGELDPANSAAWKNYEKKERHFQGKLADTRRVVKKWARKHAGPEPTMFTADWPGVQTPEHAAWQNKIEFLENRGIRQAYRKGQLTDGVTENLPPLEKYLDGMARETFKEAGYDGIVYINAVEDIGSTSFIVFDPTKIKHTDNAGTFGKTTPDMHASLAGSWGDTRLG